jgi:hypothetical protein
MENDHDRIQRALNEQKRRELEQRYGAQFSRTPPEMPPDAEADWLEYITEFERQYAANGQISVREFVGNPAILPLAAVPPEQMAEASAALLDLLLENNIVIEFDREVSDAEVYRFITEELFQEKMDNIRIEQMMHTFVYEEFHPDETSRVRRNAEMFLNAVFFRDRHIVRRMLGKKQISTGAGGMLSPEEFMHLLEGFYREVQSFTSHLLETTSCDLDLPDATVTASLTWAGKAGVAQKPVGGSGIARLQFRANPAGEWDVVAVSIPGFERHD